MGSVFVDLWVDEDHLVQGGFRFWLLDSGRPAVLTWCCSRAVTTLCVDASMIANRLSF